MKLTEDYSKEYKRVKIDPITGQVFMNELESQSNDPASMEDRVAQIEVQLMKEVMAAVAPPQQVQEDPLVKDTNARTGYPPTAGEVTMLN